MIALALTVREQIVGYAVLGFVLGLLVADIINTPLPPVRRRRRHHSRDE